MRINHDDDDGDNNNNKTGRFAELKEVLQGSRSWLSR